MNIIIKKEFIKLVVKNSIEEFTLPQLNIIKKYLSHIYAVNLTAVGGEEFNTHMEQFMYSEDNQPTVLDFLLTIVNVISDSETGVVFGDNTVTVNSELFESNIFTNNLSNVVNNMKGTDSVDVFIAIIYYFRLYNKTVLRVVEKQIMMMAE